MKRQFEIEGSTRVSVKMKLEAETREEAAKKFMEKYPDYPIDSVVEDSDKENYREHDFIGVCEVSGRPIFKGMNYESFEDGIMVLKEGE